MADWKIGPPNLIPNPSFNKDTSGWSPLGAATLSRVPGGAAALWAVNALQSQSVTPTGIQLSDPVDVVAGQEYTFSALVTVSSDATVTFSIEWFDGGSSISTTTESFAMVSDTDLRPVVSVQTAPANADSAVVSIDRGVTGSGLSLTATAIYLQSLVVLPQPNNVAPKPTGIGGSHTSAMGRETIDIVNRKWSVVWQWSYIDQADYETLRDWWDGTNGDGPYVVFDPTIGVHRIMNIVDFDPRPDHLLPSGGGKWSPQMTLREV